MCKLFIFIHLTLFSINYVNAQFITTIKTINSAIVNDSFELYISKSSKADTIKKVIYYLDANLKSGQALRNTLSKNQFNTNLANIIFIGIGHIGDYKQLRRRDFIPTDSTNSELKSQYFGKADSFYHFLSAELIPKINSDYALNKTNNGIIGHSLGGLFVIYSLTKKDSLFNNYHAISPSLWVEHFRIYSHFEQNMDFETVKTLKIYAGSKEKGNRILKGANNFSIILNNKQHLNLMYELKIGSKKNHHTIIPFALQKIFIQY